MSCRHHRDTLRGWDPAGDLPDETALHLDGCADCRDAFDARFAPALLPAVEAHPPRPLEDLMPTSSFALPAAAVIAAGAAAALFFSSGDSAPEVAPEAPVIEAPRDQIPITRSPSPRVGQGPEALRPPAHPPATNAAARDLVGADAPGLGSAEWFLGQGSLDEGEISLLVFWESWCHFCDDALLDIEGLHQDLAAEGLNVLGFTTLNKGVTIGEAYDHLEDMAEDGGVSFPNAHDVDRLLSERYEVSGIPAAVLVRDGEVIWRDHPMKLDAGTLRGLLAEQ